MNRIQAPWLSASTRTSNEGRRNRQWPRRGARSASDLCYAAGATGPSAPAGAAMMRAFGRTVSALVLIAAAAAPASSQEIDFAGSWVPIYHEDGPERLPG